MTATAVYTQNRTDPSELWAENSGELCGVLGEENWDLACGNAWNGLRMDLGIRPDIRGGGGGIGIAPTGGFAAALGAGSTQLIDTLALELIPGIDCYRAVTQGINGWNLLGCGLDLAATAGAINSLVDTVKAGTRASRYITTAPQSLVDDLATGSRGTTVHGAERVAGAGATRGGVLNTAEISVVRGGGTVYQQSNGAVARVLQQADGRYSVVVDGNRGLITTFKNLSQNSLDRLGKNYGWTQP